MKVEIIKIGVTANGKDVPVGEQRETDEASGKSLIADGYAKEIKETVAKNAFKSPVDDLNPSGDKLSAGGTDAQTGGNQDGLGGTNDDTTPEEKLAKIKKALDSKYKRDPLYEAALAAGVEIAVDTTKPKIIEAIIAQGKVEALLK